MKMTTKTKRHPPRRLIKTQTERNVKLSSNRKRKQTLHLPKNRTSKRPHQSQIGLKSLLQRGRREKARACLPHRCNHCSPQGSLQRRRNPRSTNLKNASPRIRICLCRTSNSRKHCRSKWQVLRARSRRRTKGRRRHRKSARLCRHTLTRHRLGLIHSRASLGEKEYPFKRHELLRRSFRRSLRAP